MYYLVNEVKALGRALESYASKHTQVPLTRPQASQCKQTWIDYIGQLCTFLDSNPTLWAAIQSNITSTQQIMQPSSIASVPIYATIPIPTLAPFSAVQTDRNMSVVSNDTSVSSHPQPLQPQSCAQIEYFEGKECLDISKYPNGIPQPLLQELHRISEYKGYPSKLRYEQVRIKQEKIEKASRPPQIPVDGPQNPMEQFVVNSLQQMGFTDLREIMHSIRHLQNQNSMIDANMMVEMAMMYIVQQREEKDEAEKMDAARIASEHAMVLQEKEDDDSDDIEIVYSVNEVLGTSEKRSDLYKDSFLLCSSSLRDIFRTIFEHSEEGRKYVEQLLDIEKKSLKWYGTDSESFFRYILTEKIEHLSTKSNTSDYLQSVQRMVQSLKDEINNIEHGLYVVSDDSLHLRAPIMFRDAHNSAISRGLISRDIQIE